MKAALEAIRQKIVVELQEAHDMQTLENIRVKFLGKKGELTAILKQMDSTAEKRIDTAKTQSGKAGCNAARKEKSLGKKASAEYCIG